MRAHAALAIAVVTGVFARSALGAPAGPGHRTAGVSIVRALGPHAIEAFAPRGAPGMGALVLLPDGVRASDWGLAQAAPGIARFWGQPSSLLAFADAHPAAAIEVAPPLHPLLDKALGFVDGTGVAAIGLDGSGVAVGIADTGLDVTHGDFLDAHGHPRVAWMLDLSLPPRRGHVHRAASF